MSNEQYYIVKNDGILYALLMRYPNDSHLYYYRWNEEAWNLVKKHSFAFENIEKELKPITKRHATLLMALPSPNNWSQYSFREVAGVAIVNPRGIAKGLKDK